jgi:hypothetical protein
LENNDMHTRETIETLVAAIAHAKRAAQAGDDQGWRYHFSQAMNAALACHARFSPDLPDGYVVLERDGAFILYSQFTQDFVRELDAPERGMMRPTLQSIITEACLVEAQRIAIQAQTRIKQYFPASPTDEQRPEEFPSGRCSSA